MTQVFLTTGAPGSFPDPGNWNPNANYVEVIATGGLSGISAAAPSAVNGSGGGGGAYAYAANLQGVTFPAPYYFNGYNTSGTLTNAVTFNSSSPSFVNTGNVVSASCGQIGTAQGSGASGGGTSFYPAGYAGGNGGGMVSSGSTAGSGGGGAAGPHGAGGAGVAGVAATAGAGGSADGGWVGGGAGGGAGVGAAGANGLWWDTTHGPGGGGAGGNYGSAGGNAGSFGGGGGGGTGTRGNGGPGIIVLTYLPRGYKQVFLLAGTTSFPDPGDWNPNANTVEIVGTGSQGWSHLSGGLPLASGSEDPQPLATNVAGIGGGGGGYGKGTNRADPFPVALNLPPNNAFVNQASSLYANWGDPQGGSTNPDTQQGLVYAGIATGAGSGTSMLSYGGLAGGYRDSSNNLNTNGYAGGNGGGTGASTTLGAGGGGAGGPHGAGSVGGNAAASTGNVGAGGAADGGCVIGTPQSPANVGFSGFPWDPWAATPHSGVGGGGAGGGAGQTEGGAARGYGGGGGGGPSTGTAQALGGDAICIVTYLPAPPANAFAMILAE